MSKCTAAEMIAAAEYYVGYCEKASSSYAETRDKDAFTKNVGSNNYTWFGFKTGFQAQAWCATFITQVAVEACGNVEADAKALLRNVYPYYNVTQIDNVPSGYSGLKDYWTPKVGDIVVFKNSSGSSRTHTGLVYKISGSTIYTIEGNTSDKCAEHSYSMTSTTIYGYWRPDYADGDNTTQTTSGGEVTLTVDMLQYGSSGPQVKTIQRILYAYGIKGKDGKTLAVDGQFGDNTKYAVETIQDKLGLVSDGIVGTLTWNALVCNLA